MATRALEQRILDFAREASTGDFGELALALFEQQYGSLPRYRRHCETLGIGPESISNWREIPPVDTSERSGFESSERSGPAQPAQPAETARELARISLRELVTPGSVWLVVDEESKAGIEPVIAALVREAPRDSLVSRSQRLDAKRLRSWLGARQRDRQPVQILAAAAGYANLIELLERRSLKFRLPPGSAAFCVQPFRAAAASCWSAPLAERLGLNPEACRRVLEGPSGATPLLEVSGDRNGSFRLPHWVRAKSSDSGHLAILDLASIDTPAHRIEPVAARVDSDGDGRVLFLSGPQS